MGKKQIIDGQERFDGFAVTVYDGKFSGSFDLDDDIAAEHTFDDVVTYVVTTRVGAANFSETKLGDVKRTNTYQVIGVTALDAKTAATVLLTLGATKPEDIHEIPGQTNLYDHLEVNLPDLPAPELVSTGSRLGDPELEKFLTEDF